MHDGAKTAFDRDTYTILKRAVEALAGVCDGAQMRDDEGFDGSDTRAGHLLAFLPLEAWPLSSFHRAWRWTKKYHRQLELMQIDCTALPEPAACEGEDRQIALLPDETGFYVIFPYDEALIEAFRRIPGGMRHSQPISKKLVFHYRTVQHVAGAGEALLAFAEQYSFQFGPGVRDLASRPGMVTATERSAYQVVAIADDAFALYFPRDEALNREVKAIPGKVPCTDGGFHWRIPATLQAMFALYDFLERHPQFSVPPEVEERLRTLQVS